MKGEVYLVNYFFAFPPSGLELCVCVCLRVSVSLYPPPHFYPGTTEVMFCAACCCFPGLLAGFPPQVQNSKYKLCCVHQTNLRNFFFFFFPERPLQTPIRCFYLLPVTLWPGSVSVCRVCLTSRLWRKSFPSCGVKLRVLMQHRMKNITRFTSKKKKNVLCVFFIAIVFEKQIYIHTKVVI